MAQKVLKDFQELGKEFGLKSDTRFFADQPSRGKPPVTDKIDFMREDADYVAIAEERIKQIGIYENGRYNFGDLTTSKLRNILSMANEIYNEVLTLLDSKLPAQINNKLKQLKVRLVYESGRDTSQKRCVKNFIQKTGLIEGVDAIAGEKDRFLRYANYLEALVAYHRYHGGKD